MVRIAWNRKSQDQFIKEAMEVHGDKYSYHAIKYKGTHKKVNIWCKFHGKFFPQIAKNHIHGQGCPDCGNLIKGRSCHIKAKNLFLSKALKIHGKKYDYLNFVYISAETKSPIFCKKHKILFHQSPIWHVRGTGCHECRKIKTSETGTKLFRRDFISKAKEVHGNKYGYSQCKYRNNRIPIDIYCREHRVWFEKSPKHHLRGQGCQKCAKIEASLKQPGFKKSFELTKNEKRQICFFYYLKLKNKKESFYKIGISKAPAIRFREIKNESQYDIKIIHLIKLTRFKARFIEENFLKDFRDFRIIPKKKFKGCFECFGMDILGINHP